MDRGEAEAAVEAAERIASRFGERFAEHVSLRRDRALAAELAIEARPVAEALVTGVRGASRVDPEDGALREAVALASLLGRRAAVLGATPSAAVLIVPCLVEAAASEDARARALLEPLRAVCMEGYVAAREEALDARSARRAAEAIGVVEAAPGCVCVVVAGAQDAGELERAVDELGRDLLDRDARACVVDAGGLAAPDPEVARQLFALHVTCSMLGVRCIFARVSEGWRSAAREAGLDLSEVSFAPDFASGLREALAAVGVELRARAGLGDVLRRMVRRS